MYYKLRRVQYACLLLLGFVGGTDLIADLML
jgi:hypothetical protein